MLEVIGIIGGIVALLLIPALIFLSACVKVKIPGLR